MTQTFLLFIVQELVISQMILQVTLHRLYTAHLYIRLSRRTHAAAGHVHTAGVPLGIITKPSVASAADVDGSSRSCRWNAKAPARGSECPWTQHGSYYLPLCPLCLLSSALQGPPQKVQDFQGLKLTWAHKFGKEIGLERVCVQACMCVWCNLKPCVSM